MTGHQYDNLRAQIFTWDEKQIFLPPDEYAKVISELNSRMSDKDRRSELVVKPIGDYVYVVRNFGFNDYIIVGKYLIEE